MMKAIYPEVRTWWQFEFHHYVKDLDKLHSEPSADLEVVLELQTKFFGMREFTIRYLNGYFLALPTACSGHQVENSEPHSSSSGFEPPLLDKRGSTFKRVPVNKTSEGRMNKRLCRAKNWRWLALMIICGAATPVTDGSAAEGPFIDKLIGTWTGTGRLLGTDSNFSMQWEWVLNGRFARLTFQNRFLKAEAFYRAVDEETYEGTWFDSRGMTLPLKASIENGAMVTNWGSPETEQGRTIYRPLDNHKIEVQDFVLKDNIWKPFGAASYSRVADPLTIVKAQAEAFNAQDVEGMAANAHPEATWISVIEDSVTVETDGEAALRNAMTSYFTAFPTARAQIEDALVSGSYVVIRERTSWQGKNGEQSQIALGVYEIRDNKVRRVWYFPAER